VPPRSLLARARLAAGAMALAAAAGGCSLISLDTLQAGQASSGSSGAGAGGQGGEPSHASVGNGASGGAASAGTGGGGGCALGTPTDCGACGHDCRGGQCVQGACTPVLLISGLDSPVGVAVDDTGIYVGTDDQLAHYTLDDLAYEALAPAVDAQYVMLFLGFVVWAEYSGALRSVQLSNGEVTEIGQSPDGRAVGIAAQALQVYFSTYDYGHIYSADIPLIGPEPIYTQGNDEYPEGLTTDGGFLYWTNNGTGSVARKNPEEPGFQIVAQLPTGGEGPAGLAIARGVLYVALQDASEIAVLSTEPGENLPSNQQRLAVGGFPTGLAFHDGALYFTDAKAGTVSRVVP
jgi:hypothetical protein